MNIRILIYFIINISFWLFILKYFRNSIRIIVDSSNIDNSFYEKSLIHSKADFIFMVIMTFILVNIDKFLLYHNTIYFYIFIFYSMFFSILVTKLKKYEVKSKKDNLYNIMKKDRFLRSFNLSYAVLNLILVLSDCLYYYI